MRDVTYWVKTLDLRPHPEGGFFRRTYCSPLPVQSSAGQSRDRRMSSAIYYLLQAGERSSLHRIDSDEMWHFYAGSPLSLHIIGEKGEYSRMNLGPDPEKGMRFQALTPAGSWFGALVDDPAPDAFSLVGCTVTPEFVPWGFELADADRLVRMFPQHEQIIRMLAGPKPFAG